MGFGREYCLLLTHTIDVSQVLESDNLHFKNMLRDFGRVCRNEEVQEYLNRDSVNINHMFEQIA